MLAELFQSDHFELFIVLRFIFLPEYSIIYLLEFGRSHFVWLVQRDRFMFEKRKKEWE